MDNNNGCMKAPRQLLKISKNRSYHLGRQAQISQNKIKLISHYCPSKDICSSQDQFQFSSETCLRENEAQFTDESISKSMWDNWREKAQEVLLKSNSNCINEDNSNGCQFMRISTDCNNLFSPQRTTFDPIQVSCQSSKSRQYVNQEEQMEEEEEEQNTSAFANLKKFASPNHQAMEDSRSLFLSNMEMISSKPISFLECYSRSSTATKILFPHNDSIQSNGDSEKQGMTQSGQIYAKLGDYAHSTSNQTLMDASSKPSSTSYLENNSLSLLCSYSPSNNFLTQSLQPKPSLFSIFDQLNKQRQQNSQMQSPQMDSSQILNVSQMSTSIQRNVLDSQLGNENNENSNGIELEIPHQLPLINMTSSITCSKIFQQSQQQCSESKIQSYQNSSKQIISQKPLRLFQSTNSFNFYSNKDEDNFRQLENKINEWLDVNGVFQVEPNPQRKMNSFSKLSISNPMSSSLLLRRKLANCSLN